MKEEEEETDQVGKRQTKCQRRLVIYVVGSMQAYTDSSTLLKCKESNSTRIASKEVEIRLIFEDA